MTMNPLINATNKAKQRTKRNIGTEVRQGLFRVVDVVYDSNGKSTVIPLSQFASINDTISKLEAL